MIVRMWRGWIRTEKTAEYVDYIEETGLSEYRATPGNLGAQMLTRDLGDGRTEFVTVSWWPDIEHVKAFAGDDYATAKYYPEDDEYLVDRDNDVPHFELAESSTSVEGEIVVSGHLIVADREVYLDTCRAVVQQARASDGCIDYALSADLIEPDRINILERWSSQQALDTFRGDGVGDEQGSMITSASVVESDVARTRTLS